MLWLCLVGGSGGGEREEGRTEIAVRADGEGLVERAEARADGPPSDEEEADELCHGHLRRRLRGEVWGGAWRADGGGKRRRAAGGGNESPRDS